MPEKFKPISNKNREVLDDNSQKEKSKMDNNFFDSINRPNEPYFVSYIKKKIEEAINIMRNHAANERVWDMFVFVCVIVIFSLMVFAVYKYDLNEIFSDLF